MLEPTDKTFCLLTINLPTGLVDEFLDALRQVPQWVSGCTVVRAEGFGIGGHYVSVLEQVRGRANRSLAQIVLEQPHLEPTLTYLAQGFGEAGLWHWVIPVQSGGPLRLATSSS